MLKFLRWLLGRRDSEPVTIPRASNKGPAMQELRQMFLARLIQPASTVDGELLVAMMDWPVDRPSQPLTVTVLGTSTGDASLYTTSTFGIIGGGGDENVRQAALEFVACARKYAKLATVTDDYSYPDSHQVRFFLVFPNRTASLTFNAAETRRQGSPAEDLFNHGQHLVTQLRLITSGSM